MYAVVQPQQYLLLALHMHLCSTYSYTTSEPENDFSGFGAGD